MAEVTWKRAAEGVYKRTDRRGRVRYRAVVWVRDPDWTADPSKPRNTPARKQIAATFDKLENAKDWREDYGGSKPKKAPKRAELTLQQAYDALHADPRVRYSPATVTLHADLWNALSKAQPSLLGARLDNIDQKTLGTALGKITAPSMRDKTRQLVGLIYRHAGVEPNPAVKEYTPRTRADRMAEEKENGSALDDGAVERLIAAMPEEYRTLIRLLWRVGLRPGEAFALTVGQFDPDEARLIIDRSVNDGEVGPTKTGYARRPFLPSSIAAELTEHIRRYSDWTDPDALIFPAKNGNMIHADNWRRRVFAPAAKKAGLVGVKPYTLRHTACSNAVASGIDVVTVAEMTGHSVYVLLNTYAHYVEKAGRKAADMLDAAIRGESRVPEVVQHG